MFKKVTFFK